MTLHRIVGQVANLRRVGNPPESPRVAAGAGRRGTLWVARRIPSCPTIHAGCLTLVLAAMACTAPIGQTACRPVEGERILARDLALAIPAFGALVPELPVAFAPVPGSRRIMHAVELAALARKNAIELPAPEDLCFEWPLQLLDRAAVMEAMRAALDAPSLNTRSNAQRR